MRHGWTVRRRGRWWDRRRMRQEVRRRKAVWEISDCSAKSFRGAARQVVSIQAVVSACVCVWVDAACVIRFTEFWRKLPEAQTKKLRI